jgi:hypothetical protein
VPTPPHPDKERDDDHQDHHQRSLHFSTVDQQWVVTAYALAFGSLLLGGRLAELVSRKVTFLASLAGFAAASAAGAATSFGMLVTARACQAPSLRADALGLDQAETPDKYSKSAMRRSAAAD